MCLTLTTIPAFKTALRNKNGVLVKCLVDRGVDINQNDSFDKDTPLHDAASSCDPEKVKILIENGADPTVLNLYEQTAMDIAQDRLNRDPNLPNKEKFRKIIGILKSVG